MQGPEVYKIFEGSPLYKCDKCGMPVAKENNAVIFDRGMGDNVEAAGKARHLLPVGGCEGSPSRLKMLLGYHADGSPLSEREKDAVSKAFEHLTGQNLRDKRVFARVLDIIIRRQ